jgi:hypothetical protein
MKKRISKWFLIAFIAIAAILLVGITAIHFEEKWFLSHANRNVPNDLLRLSQIEARISLDNYLKTGKTLSVEKWIDTGCFDGGCGISSGCALYSWVKSNPEPFCRLLGVLDKNRKYILLSLFDFIVVDIGKADEIVPVLTRIKSDETKQLISNLNTKKDAFTYSKGDAIRHARKALENFDSITFNRNYFVDPPLRNCGLNSTECNDDKVQVVYIAFESKKDSSIADARLIYREGRFLESRECGFSMSHPDTTIYQIMQTGVDSNCEDP